MRLSAKENPMFGMLDYRAQKLYLIIFGIPVFVLSLLMVFGLPCINYALGLYFSNDRVWQIIVSVAFVIPTELFWNLIILTFITKIFETLFELIIDIIPTDGRTEEEAKIIVRTGEKGIILWEMAKNPRDWSDETIIKFSRSGLLNNIFFRRKVIERCNIIRDRFINNLDLEDNDRNTDGILEENNLTLGKLELAATNGFYLRWILSYSLFAYLLFTNPLVN